MAHFYGTLQGNRGQASRLGTKNSGLSTVAASYQGSVYVDIVHDKKTGEDIVTVALHTWFGKGIYRELYCGPIGGPK